MNDTVAHSTNGLHWKWGQGKSDESSDKPDSGTQKPAHNGNHHVTTAQLSGSKSAVDLASTFASNAKNSHEKKAIATALKISKHDAKFMTDEELKARVGRMSLEEQYGKLSSAQRDQGRDAVSAFLGATTTALNVASAALSVAVVIKQLNSKIPD